MNDVLSRVVDNYATLIDEVNHDIRFHEILYL